MPPPLSEQLDGSPPHAEEEEEACPPEDQEAGRQEHEEEAERLRLEEEQAQREAEERARREQEEAVERDRRVREEALRADTARQAEFERQAREQERKVVVGAFLKEHGYTDVAAPRRTMRKTKYPIHSAAKAGDAKIVAALLEEGANPAQKTSAGQTALQVAQQKNKKGSHANVLLVLGGA
eukprot:CAMPEP_0179241058 /NCGR_PEP_ID=MMETSP0797-20121207/16296_1 /TAXON_ID=47934 /ORGANISM="Dinophysis acuminata, Strain DAEP01" /LENGTH=180 /DNA_ID=CAMNT_0020948431 /DNA_START=130 /DNA_END=672 /DNA_ORIENTATION=+